MTADKTVGDYVALQRGNTYSGKLVGLPGPALLGLGSIEPGGGFRARDFKTFGGECPEKITVRSGDLFVALKGATKDGSMVGSVARLPSLVSFGRLTQDTARLDFFDDDPDVKRHLYWVLRTPQYRDYCHGRVTGSASASFSREDFLSFPVPSIAEPTRVLTRALDALEDKVEQNRQTTDALERLARAIFGNWRSANVAAIRLQRVAELEAAGTLLIGDGYRAKRIELAETGVPFIRAANVVEAIEPSSAELLGTDAVMRAGPKRSQLWDTVFTSKGTVGRVGFVTPATGDVVYAPQVCFWRSMDHAAISPFILHCWMRTGEFAEQCSLVKGQTDMADFVSLKDQRAMLLPIAPPNIQAEIAPDLEAIYRLVSELADESKKLAELRSYLLPKLLLGTLRIRDPQQPTESA